MEREIVCLDTSILIDYFRKKSKEDSTFYKLTAYSYSFAVTTITVFEIYRGVTPIQKLVSWNYSQPSNESATRHSHLLWAYHFRHPFYFILPRPSYTHPSFQAISIGRCLQSVVGKAVVCVHLSPLRGEVPIQTGSVQ